MRAKKPDRTGLSSTRHRYHLSASSASRTDFHADLEEFLARELEVVAGFFPARKLQEYVCWNGWWSKCAERPRRNSNPKLGFYFTSFVSTVRNLWSLVGSLRNRLFRLGTASVWTTAAVFPYVGDAIMPTAGRGGSKALARPNYGRSSPHGCNPDQHPGWWEASRSCLNS